MSGAGRRRALYALLVVTVLWGFTFLWMKENLDAAARLTGRPSGLLVVAVYVAARFGAAAALLALWPRARAGLDGGAWRAGFVIGALLAAGFGFQMLGLSEVSPPVSAFLTSLYVVFAAILTAAIHRERPRFTLLAGVALATVGAGFIQGPPQLTFGRPEWLTVACAAVFAFHILATDRLTKRHAPLAVTVAAFTWTGLFAAGVAAIALTRPETLTLAEVGALFVARSFLTPLLLSVVFATILALTLMNLFQRDLDPIRAAIVYALEPIWTTLFAWAFGLGRPSAWLLAGGGALLLGNLVAEIGEARRSAPQRAS